MSARILGLDVSTCTGYAFWVSNCHIASIETGVLELPEARTVYDPKTKKNKHDYNWDDWRVAQMGPKILRLLKQFKPDMVVIEERLRFSKTGDSGFGMTQALHGAIYSHVCTMGIVFGTINVNSWRTPAFGEGFEQPLVPALDRSGQQKVNKETGKLEFKKKDWGDLAVEKCESLGIQLPSKKAISHNAAEAALIAMLWRCQKRVVVAATRDHKRYIDFLQRPDRAAAEPMGAAA